MRKLLTILAAVVFLAMAGQAQITPGPSTQSTAVSGTTLTFGNALLGLGGLSATFEEKISGAPATVSIVIQGCMRGTTCDTLETYTTVANANRAPTISKIYDYFTVTPSWTGGTSPSVLVNYSYSQTGSAGGAAGASPLTTNGDIYTFSGGANARLAIGSAGQFLFVSSGAPAWNGLLTDNGTTLSYTGTGGASSPAFTATGSGAALKQAGIADPGVPGAGNSSMYASNTFLRWMAYFNNVGPKALGTWGCTTTGCLQVGGSSQVNGLNTEILVAGNSAGLGVLTETSAGAAAWIAATNSSGTAIATSTGTLTNGDLAVIANASGDYGDGGFLASNIVRKDTTNTSGTGMTLDMSASTVTNPFKLPLGTGVNPSLQFSGMASNTGLWSPSAAVLAWQSTGNNVADFVNNGIEIANTRAFLASSTNAGNGAVTLGISPVGSGAGTQAWALGNGTVGDDTALTRWGTCRISSDVTLSTSATSICAFTLPNVSKVWALECHIGWAVTAGTTPTLSFGVNASQTPAGSTQIFGEILTTNTNTATQASATLSASGALNVITSPTLTTAATLFQASLFGTINANATSGTFTVAATGAGASFAGAVKAGSTCSLI
jgi:hypothetical protein